MWDPHEVLGSLAGLKLGLSCSLVIEKEVIKVSNLRFLMNNKVGLKITKNNLLHLERIISKLVYDFLLKHKM